MFGEFFNPRLQKPLRVSELIGTFNRREPRTAEDEDEAAVKQRRRASLNLQFAPSTAVMSDTEKSEKWLKAQRRKSTSSLLSNNIENLKIQEQVKQRKTINQVFLLYAKSDTMQNFFCLLFAS